MRVISTVKEMKEISRSAKKCGKRIGYVPTMGFLHDGHMSLVRKAKEENDMVVVSIFVNPIQFGENEDYDIYPRDFEKDSAMLLSEGADYIFNPSVEEMYPEGDNTRVGVSGITDKLCGASRPGHFSGVTTVVNKFFQIVLPDRAYFGLKDAQQVAVIERMVGDLFMDVEIVPCPIVREADGLALSSRNTYLTAEDRKQALSLSRGIFKAKDLFAKGERSASKLRKIIVDEIEKEDVKIEYVEVLSFPMLEEVGSISGKSIIALAVRVGKVRLIDNVILEG